MKKINIFKSLFLITPVLTTPLIAAGCNQNNKKETAAQFYVKTFTAAWQSQYNLVAPLWGDVALLNSNELNLTEFINDVIKTADNDAKTSKDIPKNYNVQEFRNITISSEKNPYINISKAANNQYILKVYPRFILDDPSAKTALKVKFSLNIAQNNRYSTTISNDIFIPERFKIFNTENSDLLNDNVASIYVSNQKAFIGGEGGISVATPQTNGSYEINSYTSSDNSGLTANNINTIYADKNENIFATGSNEAKIPLLGIEIGTKNQAGKYTFTFNDNGLAAAGAFPNDVITDDSGTIFTATNEGVGIATKSSSGYNAFNVTKANLSSKDVKAIDVSRNGNTVYIATSVGIDIGTASGNTYTFKNLWTPAEATKITKINDLQATSDGSIYAATNQGLWFSKKNGSTYGSFSQIGLADTNVNDVRFAADNSIVYAATDNGLYIGTKTSTNYSFKEYRNNDKVTDVYVSSDQSIIYIGITNPIIGGFAISKKNWFN